MRFEIVWTIFRKEITESLRDRMTLMVVVGLPMLIYPLMVTGITKLQRSHAATEDKRVSKVVVWGEAPSALLDWLRRTNTLELSFNVGLPPELQRDLAGGKLQPPTENVSGSRSVRPPTNATNPQPETPLVLAARELLGGPNADAVLMLWPGFAEEAMKEGLGRATIYLDSVQPSSVKAEERLVEQLAGFRRDLVTRREQARALSKGFSTAISSRSEDVAPPRRRSGRILGVGLPFVLIMLSATGALYAAIDLTAGEKDRATMQTLLCAPVHSLEIVTGKFLTVWCISLIAAAANSTSLGLTITSAVSASGLSMSPWVLLMVVPCLLPVTCTISALFLAVAVLARDAKDAGNLLGATMSLLMIPMGATLVPGVDLNAWTSFIPLVNIGLLVKALFAGGTKPEFVFLALLGAATYALLALLLAARVFSQEQVLLGEKGGFRTLLHPGPRREVNPAPGHALLTFALVLVAMFYGSLLLTRLGIIPAMLVSQYGLMLLPVVLITALMRFPIRSTFSLNLPHWRSVAGAALVGVSAGVGVAGLAIRILPPEESVARALEKLLMLGDQPAPLWVAWLVLGITPALCEETLFRGLIFSGLRRWGVVAAILLSALLFGLAHSSIYRLLPTFSLGLVLGFVLWRTGSIYCSMLVHALNNGLMVTLVRAPGLIEKLGLNDTTAPPWSLTLGALAIMGVGLALLPRHQKSWPTTPPHPGNQE
jgi:sodium transport system permease protein